MHVEFCKHPSSDSVVSLRCPDAPRPETVRPCLLPCKKDCIVTPFSNWTQCPTSCEAGTHPPICLSDTSVCLLYPYTYTEIYCQSVCCTVHIPILYIVYDLSVSVCYTVHILIYSKYTVYLYSIRFHIWVVDK